jgi:O-antigen ligase
MILLAVGAVIVGVSPFGQTVLERLASGFAAQDKAAALRLDEYRNAFSIIARYPLLGIGFGPAPDIDLQEGVSSLYLSLAEQTGLIGSSLYLLAIGSALVGALRAGRSAASEPATLLSGLLAAVVAALVAGLFDHYFVNKDFPHMVALLWLNVGLLVVTAALARSETQGVARGAPEVTRGAQAEAATSRLPGAIARSTALRSSSSVNGLVTT